MSKGVDAWQISGDLIVFSGERGSFLRDYDRLNALVQEFLELLPDYVREERSKKPVQPLISFPALAQPPGNLNP